MIFTFDEEQEVGGVWRPWESPYKYYILTGRDGDLMEPQPLFIVRESNYEEAVKFMVEAGGKAEFVPVGLYYYEVTTD